jgi:hypothetical protein
MIRQQKKIKKTVLLSDGPELWEVYALDGPMQGLCLNIRLPKSTDQKTRAH